MSADNPYPSTLATDPDAMPQVVDIPRQLLEPWLDRQSTDYIDLRLTKRDIDRLFFAIMKSLSAQDETLNCIVAWSSGDTDRANEALQKSRRALIDGQNEIRQFLMAVMAGAK